MNTHVIILAQGCQRRMGDLAVPKQLLTLPAHAAHKAPNTQIVNRTIMQVAKILTHEARESCESMFREWLSHHLTVVANQAFEERMEPVKIPILRGIGAEIGMEIYPSFCALADPGNSSIKGLSRYLDHVPVDPVHTVVLLGDVVYSWACLEELLRRAHDGDVTFAGTSDLGPGGGELWGVAWYKSTDRMMRGCLAQGLAASSKHQDVYQPGQLRHWLWAVDRFLSPRDGLPDPAQWSGARDWWVPIDDYTMDVDLPEHIDLLRDASDKALADDLAHGVPCG